MLKLGCTLPNLANICLHKSSDFKFYQFFLSDTDLLETLRKDMKGSPSIVFTRKAVANETFIRKSNNLCKSTVETDASQLYPYSIYQDMPTGLYTRWDYNEKRKISGQDKIEFERLKICSCHNFKQADRNAKLRFTTLQEYKKLFIASLLIVIATTVRLFFKQWVVFSFLPLSRS